MVQKETQTASRAEMLGRRLRQARDLRGQPLSAVSAAAEISTAYLQKLEAGAVKQPSPHVLYQLSTALDIDYAELMRLAGYVIPGEKGKPTTRLRNELRYAFSSEELTEDEAGELARYLGWYRERQSQ